jgi:tripartite-type tricarboxylate transporter receptor subunit TctC
VLQRPEVREAFGKIAFDPRSSTPDELAAFLRFQMEVWRRTAESVGIKPE